MIIPERFQKIVNTSTSLLVFVALTFGLFCIEMFHDNFMIMNAGAPSVSMPLDSDCCAAEISQHTAFWEMMSLGILNNVGVISIILALTLILIVFTRGLRIDALIEQARRRLGLYERNSASLFVFDPLKSALARGILHPKIY